MIGYTIRQEWVQWLKYPRKERGRKMNDRIIEYARELDGISRERRRDFHRFAETGWLEMRTSAMIHKTLKELGYEVLTGREVCLEGARLGLPEEEEMRAHGELVLSQGAPAEYLTKDMKEGYTGVIGILRCGEGPVVALRFDIDALGLVEDERRATGLLGRDSLP